MCRTDPDAAPDKGISILAVEKPSEGVVFERAITSPGYRAHLLPEFSFREVTVPAENVLGKEGGGLLLSAASFVGTAALVGADPKRSTVDTRTASASGAESLIIIIGVIAGGRWSSQLYTGQPFGHG